jgi:hypothetical protein
MNLHLVLIETSGNQQYIFSTNKLRENVGASELTYRAGTQWVLEAVRTVGGPNLWNPLTSQLRNNLIDKTLNPPLEDQTYPVEVILAASGKAMLLVSEEKVGKEIIQIVTQRALKAAPGLDICGVISRKFDSSTAEIEDVGVRVPAISAINREIQDQFEVARAHRAGPVMRFLRLPCVMDCSTSGLPAAKWDVKQLNSDRQRNEEPQARSQVSLEKRENYVVSRERMETTFGFDFAHDLTELEENCDWLAIVHSDGNGLGKIFLNFGKYLKLQSHQDYVDAIRQFSLALDECTEKAFIAAVNHLPTYKRKRRERRPLVPIVLGGDDMTVVCDGRAALRFTHEYLTAFERETGANIHTQKVANASLGVGRLAACAGIAIVKPHYPFSGAYDLAGKLIESAKQVKRVVLNPQNDPWPCSAIDFHILYDASGSDLKPIRRKLEFKDQKIRLYGRPYVVTPEKLLVGANERGRQWAAQHKWAELEESVETVLKTDTDGRRLLPNSQLHELREGLFLRDRDATDARFRLIRNRYANNGIERLCGDHEQTLFLEDVRPGEAAFTRLLDVMDAASLSPDGEKL